MKIFIVCVVIFAVIGFEITALAKGYDGQLLRLTFLVLAFLVGLIFDINILKYIKDFIKKIKER